MDFDRVFRRKTVHSDFDHRQLGIAAESAVLNTDMGSVGCLVAEFGHTDVW